MWLLTCTKEQHGDRGVVWRGPNLWSGRGDDCARNVAATSRGAAPYADRRAAAGLAEERAGVAGLSDSAGTREIQPESDVDRNLPAHRSRRPFFEGCNGPTCCSAARDWSRLPVD